MTKYRQWAIRSILIIGSLATVATSAPPSFVIRGEAQMAFVGPTTVRAIVRVDTGAAAHADGLDLEIGLDSITGPWLVEAVSDDPGWMPESVVVGPEPEWLGFFFAPAEACIPEDGLCEYGVSFDVPDGQELRIQVQAGLYKHSDSSIFSQGSGDFPPGSMMSIEFDDASVER